MSNELSPYEAGGGELQPYAPSPLSPLAPSPDTWGNTPDLLREDRSSQSSNGQQQLFGSDLPQGTTEQQVNQTLNEIQAIVAGDLMRLGHAQSSISAAITWFQSNARKTPTRETKAHSYNLHDQSSDALAQSFGNAMARAGATQKFISDSLWLLGELSKKLGTQPVGTRLPRTANPTSDPTANLTDAQFEALVKHNDQVKAQTETTLRRRWGSAYTLNMRLAQDQLSKLTPAEIERLDQWTGAFPWTKMLNTETAITFLFDSAIGAGTLPKNGAAIAAEIKECENLMRTNRKAWLASDDIQARYRLLLDMRSGG